MYSGVFLHYGPGGNSDAECRSLAARCPDVSFWNQPKVKDQLNPYEALVAACVKKAEKTNAKQLIGHSFGCDLLSSIIKTKGSQLPNLAIANSVLISPLRDIPSAFVNLGRALQKKQNVKALAEAITLMTSSDGTPASDLFWNLVMQVTIHPAYAQIFWVNQQAKADFDHVAAQGPAFDGSEWQIVMNNYLFVRRQNDIQIFENKKIKAIFGAADPYLTDDDLRFWKKLLGSEQVLVVEGCGHYPHLENPDAFIKALKT